MAAGPRIRIPPGYYHPTQSCSMSLLTLERVSKRFDGVPAVDDVSFGGGPGPGGGLPGPERGRQVHHHADDHPVLRARHRDHPARRRPAGRRRPRGQAADRLPPREQSRSTPRCWSPSGWTTWPASGTSAEPSGGPPSTRRSPPPASRTSITGRSASCPRASASGWDWRPPSSTAPTSWCSTSRPRGSTPTSGWRSAGSSAQLGRERTVILSTHILPEVQFTCSRLLIINRGRIVADGPVDDLVSRAKDGARISVEASGAGDRRPAGRAARRARGRASSGRG